MKRNEVAKLRKWDFYEKFRKIVAIICMIVGCIWFRVAVFKNWHLVDGFSNCENIGDVFVGIFEIIFMEILPLVVAFIPGGFGGLAVGYTASSLVSLVVIIVSAIGIGIYDIFKWGENKHLESKIKSLRKRIKKRCNYLEGFIERVLDTIGDIRVQNNNEKLVELFKEIRAKDIYELYLAERNSIDEAKINKLRYMFMVKKVNAKIEKWSLNAVYNWCISERKLIESYRRELYGYNLTELKSTYRSIQ